MCQDMFFSRSRSTAVSRGLLGHAHGRAALESAFNVSKKADDKHHIVEELLDTKVNEPLNLQYSEQVRAA